MGYLSLTLSGLGKALRNWPRLFLSQWSRSRIFLALISSFQCLVRGASLCMRRENWSARSLFVLYENKNKKVCFASETPEETKSTKQAGKATFISVPKETGRVNLSVSQSEGEQFYTNKLIQSHASGKLEWIEMKNLNCVYSLSLGNKQIDVCLSDMCLLVACKNFAISDLIRSTQRRTMRVCEVTYFFLRLIDKFRRLKVSHMRSNLTRLSRGLSVPKLERWLTSMSQGFNL